MVIIMAILCTRLSTISGSTVWLVAFKVWLLEHDDDAIHGIEEQWSITKQSYTKPHVSGTGKPQLGSTHVHH